MDFLKLATEYSFAFQSVGIALVILSALGMHLMLPVNHKDKTLLGDAGISLAAAVFRRWGWPRAVIGYGIGALGVALFFLPMLGSY